ncbi:hypothetical protein EXA23_01615 [Vibrio cincinnatiensis]|uniref:hypothetical protein n=1 Tax=Vibrio cincinnatiensis TaxID=675 RepID=UPI001EDCB7B6|nr:hypothetical protein [Vibrio cincinnatiensis]MCG3745979.1 hypothetical protein [Vibrio cincinnatiensis]MCG3764918.1 hypothetical protein [Vibrio cincinnatiensis]
MKSLTKELAMRNVTSSKRCAGGSMAEYYQQRLSLSQNRWERMALSMMIQLCQWQTPSNE